MSLGPAVQEDWIADPGEWVNSLPSFLDSVACFAARRKDRGILRTMH